MTSAKNILLVEDEAIIAMSLRLDLSKAGYSVSHIAATGEEAITIVNREPPNLILMDVHLAGELDGIEAAHHIRAKHDVDIIFMTGYEEREIQNRFQFSDHEMIIKKPIRVSELVRIIETLD